LRLPFVCTLANVVPIEQQISLASLHVACDLV
jgi:hypothetical protein